MSEIDFNKIDEARKILGLGEKATLKEIKDTYREKAKKYHPDFVSKNKKNKKEYEDMMKKINEAYKILMDYCENYTYSFKKESVERHNKGYNSYADWFEDDWLLARRQQTKNKITKNNKKINVK